MKRLAGVALKKLGFSRHCQCVVLGNHIKAHLDQIGLSNVHIHAIEHPLPDLKPPQPLRPISGKLLRLAVTGLLRADTKDLGVAAQVATDPRVTVRMVGRKGPGYMPLPGVDEQVVATHFFKRVDGGAAHRHRCASTLPSAWKVSLHCARNGDRCVDLW